MARTMSAKPLSPRTTIAAQCFRKRGRPICSSLYILDTKTWRRCYLCEYVCEALVSPHYDGRAVLEEARKAHLRQLTRLNDFMLCGFD